MAVRVRLGDALIEQGVLSPAQVERALAEQARTGRMLGAVMVDLGFTTEETIAKVLADRLGHQYVDLGAIELDRVLVARLPEAMARRHEALPIAVEDGPTGPTLVVAMGDPSDVFAVDAIRDVVGSPVRAVMVTPSQLQAALSRVFRLDGAADTVARQAAAELAPGTERGGDANDSMVPSGVRLTDADASADDAPIVRFVNLVITQAVQDGASDIHLEPGEHDMLVRYRVDGVLREVMRQPRALHRGVVSRIKVMADLDIAERRIPQDGRITVLLDSGGGGTRPVDVRVATLPTVWGEKVVLRVLDSRTGARRLAELGFGPFNLARYEAAYKKPWGAILVTGPTGSGKSTTLYSTLREVATADRNVITVEDPVEYRLEGVNQIQVNEAAGLTFATALRSILRADPDIALVGEIRDRETAITAIEAALTGHLVLSTLHTNDAPSTPIRLVEMGVEPFLAASAITCVVAQRLARKLCERCAAEYEPTADELEQLGWREEYGTPILFHAVGCPACGTTGYRGRFALHEVMPITEDIARLVVARASSDEVRVQAIAEGMEPMRVDGLRKAACGFTSVAELLRVVG
jgi:type IV pilus assembly protein PilB